MKNTTVQISFEAEKLRAIHQYMKDETELQTELDSLLHTLYDKHVPAPVREYIESQDANEAKIMKIIESLDDRLNDNKTIE